MWFIPTYMGNASSGADNNHVNAVHPHVHGERVPGNGSVLVCVGSSPRTWGTHIRCNTGVSGSRFIPTYMGNARGDTADRLVISVHPHVHGERRFERYRPVPAVGSSPRTWGTRAQAPGMRALMRFIPTYMGNAPPVPCSRRGHTVHPHVHGERVPGSNEEARAPGSSPRTWGTHYVRGPIGLPNRFIPTYMGNALDCYRPIPGNPVHPHVHGERDLSDRILGHRAGSSPRTWGTREPVFSIGCIIRFIPTYMGNAFSSVWASFASSVHPHVHGERMMWMWMGHVVIGSSPRTWGTR